MAGCFSKFFLFVLNFAIFGIGIAVITLASLILAQTGDFQKLLDTGSFTVPIIFLLIGVAVMFLGFFGCFGALRESPCLLYTYATIVLILFCGQVGIVIYGLVEEDEIREFLSSSMVKTFNKYGGEDTELTKTLDLTQNSLKCCGVYNYTDWYNDKVLSVSLETDVPVGCCRNMEVANCNTGIEGRPIDEVEAKIYTQGCYSLLIETVESEALWLIIGACVLALVQLACITIACGLGKNSRSSQTY